MKGIARRPTLLGSVVALLAWPATLAAQGYTAEVSLFGSVVELRGLDRDSLPEEAVPGDGLTRRLEDGTIVTCIPEEFCRWFPSGEVETVSLMTEELRLSAWPGIRGLAAHAYLRGRYGSDGFWPRSDQELEALYAYVSWERGDYRVRAGRQFRTNGLGYYNFDGASFLWRGFDPVRIDLYGGWSLARNLNASRTGSLLQAADEFAPDDRGLVLGVDVTGRLGDIATGAFTYQREIRSDELALYSERVAAAVGARWRQVTVDLSADYDLAFGEFNEASGRVASPLPAGFEAGVQARRYLPHFELWTIWGAFSPVGFDEARFWIGWRSARAHLHLDGGGAWRRYDEPDAGAAFVGLEDSGWRAFGRARWDRAGGFVDVAYRAEEGSGAARYGGDLRAGRDFGAGRWISAHATSSQSFSEFRVGEQVTAGVGIDGGFRLGDVTLIGGWARYGLSYEDRPQVEDWVQHRGHLGVRYRLGTEPVAGGEPRGAYR
jgi:hypothetical protein